MEVFNKSCHSNSHFQMRQNPITIAEYSEHRGLRVQCRSKDTPAFKIVTKALLNVTCSRPTIDTVKLEWNAKYKLTLKRCLMLIFNETLSLKALSPWFEQQILHKGKLLIAFLCSKIGSKSGTWLMFISDTDFKNIPFIKIDLAKLCWLTLNFFLK